MNVAQLKPAFTGDVTSSAGSSHVRMNVAQLKRCLHLQVSQRNQPFPRSNERGSIEAVSAAGRMWGAWSFPRSNERGSIEAFLRRRGCRHPPRRSHVRMNVAQLKRVLDGDEGTEPLEFPRSNERGSIEAKRDEAKNWQANACSHVRMNVAQLKPLRDLTLKQPVPRFTRSNERGSIEASALGAIAAEELTFPRSNERGSIEAKPSRSSHPTMRRV